MTSRRCAFTLVELLIVIAIIAVLAALLLPAIALVRSQALSVRCGANLRSLVMASLSYATENNGYAKPVFYGWYDRVWMSDNSFLATWADSDAVTATTFPRSRLCPVSRPVDGSGNTVPGLSYGMNITVGEWWDIWYSPLFYGKPSTVHLPTTIRTSELICAADALYFWLGYQSDDAFGSSSYWASGQAAPEGTSVDHAVAFRHRNAANFGFFDGRVQLLRPSALPPASGDNDPKVSWWKR